MDISVKVRQHLAVQFRTKPRTNAVNRHSDACVCAGVQVDGVSTSKPAATTRSRSHCGWPRLLARCVMLRGGLGGTGRLAPQPQMAMRAAVAHKSKSPTTRPLSSLQDLCRSECAWRTKWKVVGWARQRLALFPATSGKLQFFLHAG